MKKSGEYEKKHKSVAKDNKEDDTSYTSDSAMSMQVDGSDDKIGLLEYDKKEDNTRHKCYQDKTLVLSHVIESMLPFTASRYYRR